MKAIVPVLALISVLWILGGSYYMAQSTCGNTTIGIAPLSIQDDDYQFKTSSTNQHFSFLPSNSEVSIEDQIQRSFREVAAHLARHPKRQLTLTGWYKEGEANDSQFDNLGIARAEEIKSYLVKINPNLASRILTLGEKKASVFMANGRQMDGVDFSFSNVVEAEKEDLSTNEINSSPTSTKPKINTPKAPRYVIYGREDIKNLDLNITLQQQIDNMKASLELHEGSYILVTGHSEKRSSISRSKDVAFIWANQVRRFFRNNGIRSKQIVADSKGETELLVKSDDPEAKLKNNRVVVEVILATDQSE